MPYAPSERFDAGLISHGTDMLSGDITAALKKQDEIQKTQGYNDMIMQHALQKGQVSQDDYNKYLTAGHQQQTGIAAGHAANIVGDWQRQQDEQKMAVERAQIGHFNAATAAQNALLGERNWVPTQADRDLAYSVNGDYVHTPQGYKVMPFPDRGGDKIDPSKVRAVEIPNSGGLKIVVDENGKPIKNSDLQGAVRPNPLADLLLGGGLGGGGLGGAPAFNATTPQQPAQQPPQQPAPAATAADQLKALATKALNDPNATEQHKAAARKILGL